MLAPNPLCEAGTKPVVQVEISLIWGAAALAWAVVRVAGVAVTTAWIGPLPAGSPLPRAWRAAMTAWAVAVALSVRPSCDGVILPALPVGRIVNVALTTGRLTCVASALTVVAIDAVAIVGRIRLSSVRARPIHDCTVASGIGHESLPSTITTGCAMAVAFAAAAPAVASSTAGWIGASARVTDIVDAAV